MSGLTLAEIERRAEQDRLIRAVESVFADRITTALDSDTGGVGKLAEAMKEPRGVSVDMFLEEEFAWNSGFDDKEEDGERERLLELYHVEKRRFEAEFMKKHMQKVPSRVFANIIASDAAMEAVRDPDLEENRKLMKALNASISIQGIKPIRK
jgi:hypothetical protein